METDTQLTPETEDARLAAIRKRYDVACDGYYPIGDNRCMCGATLNEHAIKLLLARLDRAATPPHPELLKPNANFKQVKDWVAGAETPAPPPPAGDTK